jgi:hypothetical protein
MKKETLRENLPVIIAIGLPVLLVLCIALLTWLPSFGPKPGYDFLFIKDTSRSYYEQSSCVVYSNYYEVKDGYLTKKPYITTVFDKREVSEPCYGYAQIKQKDSPDLFVYNTKEDVVFQITFEEASKFKTRGESISPDGFKVSKRMLNRGVFELFGGGNNEGVFISKKNFYIKTSISEGDNGTYSYYNDDFKFITWIDTGLLPRIGHAF